MKILFPLLLLCSLAFSNLSAQIFTTVTSGEIYNDSTALGGAWGDFNRDGHLDFFASLGQLYLNNTDGTFTKTISGDIVDNGVGIGATAGDYDNDGDIDIYTASPASGAKLFRNNGDGSFEQVLEEPFVSDSSDYQASSWVDIEQDGDLDLFVTSGGNMGFSDNILYINNDGNFTRDNSRVITQDSSGSVNCSWADFNNDGHVDLFIANAAPGRDSIANHLYLNNGDGSFTRLLEGPVVEDQSPCLGSSWGDYNNDGFQDLFVSSTEANQLYRNNGDNTFTYIDAGELVTEVELSSGSTWGDFDNDGDLDLLVASISSSNFLYENNGDGTFSKVLGEAFSGHSAFGCTTADWDKDGDLDILFTRTLEGNHQPYLNNGNANNWINIHCTGVLSNTSAIGAQVWLKATINGNEVWQLREISGQTGVLGQSSPNAHFGLGAGGIVDSLIIRWPSGVVQRLGDIAVNTHLEVTEAFTSSTEETFSAANINNFSIYPNPTDVTTTIQFELDRSAHISLQLIDGAGKTLLNLTEEHYPTGAHKLVLSTVDLPNGIYHCQLVIDHQLRLHRKVIVQR